MTTTKKYITLDLRLPFGEGYIVTLDKSERPVSGFFYSTFKGNNINNINNYEHTQKLNSKCIDLEVKKIIVELIDQAIFDYGSNIDPNDVFHPCLVRDCKLLGYDLGNLYAIRESKEFAYHFNDVLGESED